MRNGLQRILLLLAAAAILSACAMSHPPGGEQEGGISGTGHDLECSVDEDDPRCRRESEFQP